MDYHRRLRKDLSKHSEPLGVSWAREFVSSASKSFTNVNGLGDSPEVAGDSFVRFTYVYSPLLLKTMPPFTNMIFTINACGRSRVCAVACEIF